jgi:hypothetical protein
MRYAQTATRLIAGAALFAAVPAAAGQTGSGIDLSQPMLERAPAETGKPLLPPPNSTLPSIREGCIPALPCGTRLLGAVRKDGAVEVQVPALRW